MSSLLSPLALLCLCSCCHRRCYTCPSTSWVPEALHHFTQYKLAASTWGMYSISCHTACDRMWLRLFCFRCAVAFSKITSLEQPSSQHLLEPRARTNPSPSTNTWSDSALLTGTTPQVYPLCVCPQLGYGYVVVHFDWSARSLTLFLGACCSAALRGGTQEPKPVFLGSVGSSSEMSHSALHMLGPPVKPDWPQRLDMATAISEQLPPLRSR